MALETTISQDTGGPGGRVHQVPCLFRVFEAGRPAASRHRLDGLAEVELVRGEGPWLRTHARLTLVAADPWLSSRHFRIGQVAQRYVLEDAGSRNGTRLNGERVQRATLADGDVIEAGRTFFVYRDAMPLAEPVDVDAEHLGAPTAELATLVPGLAGHFADLARVAASLEPVLVRGDTGTGKEVVARAVHTLSRRPGPLVAVNCGALPETLVESELFGFKKGAFSGAAQDRAGLVRSSHAGTLFLDEIADLRPASQAALLRVLQEREVVPLGASAPVAVDLRVVAATHRDLDALVAAGDFRADLLQRLTGFVVRLPALRERREDLGLLLAALATRRGVSPSFSAEALRLLVAHAWPGHVRELDRVLGSACALAGAEPITPAHLPGALQPGEAPLSRKDGELRAQLEALLREHRGNLAAVARAMGKGRMQIHRWLARFELDVERFRDG
jgi:DNA-binding NtrC family response regulator